MMAQQGAALQTYNNELVKCLEELCERRNDLQKDIQKDEQDKVQLERQLQNVQHQLDKVNRSLSEKLETREKYDKTITESEKAYLKILESSQVLLNVVKKDVKDLQKSETASASSSSFQKNWQTWLKYFKMFLYTTPVPW